MPVAKKSNTSLLFSIFFLLFTLVGCKINTDNQSYSKSEIPKNSFAVVELFTSLGCPTCPTAEKEINALVDEANTLDLPLYVLTYHVDYWNRQKWSDPYSMAACSKRQRMYAGILHSKNIHTPQSVLNGVSEFPIINSKQYLAFIFQALKKDSDQKQSIRAKIAQIDDSLRISITLGRINPREQLVIVMTQRSGQPAIKSGENAGIKINCVNIVRYLTEIPCAAKNMSHMFKIPEALKNKASDIVLFTQNKLTGRITSALKTEFIKQNFLTSL